MKNQITFHCEKSLAELLITIKSQSQDSEKAFWEKLSVQLKKDFQIKKRLMQVVEELKVQAIEKI